MASASGFSSVQCSNVETDGHSLPCRTTSFYRALADTADPARDPIAAQFVPRPEEQQHEDYESPDPLADRRFAVCERLIHRYPDRVLLLTTDTCAVYCRHCFRRHFTGGRRGAPTAQEMDNVLAYITKNPGVQEILLSGGDPLTLSDSQLAVILNGIRTARPDMIVRICSRIPVVNPSRISETTARMLAGGHDAEHDAEHDADHGAAGTWFVTHVNHPREVSPAFISAIRLLMRFGIPVLNQAVLLRGINDDIDTLEELFRALYRAGVKPYYLLQTDLAAGTYHFRVPISQGIVLIQELRRRLSGPAVPVYALDLPGGGGKVPIESALLRLEPSAYVFRGPDGLEYSYPRAAE
ncbi:MAG: KamA family radical SAM protein [Spirochaeta sp.]|nr:KamA family radical SAM protein [Spirochaeta sp.]